MELSDLDLELLEVAAVQVPWYMVCGEFHERYGSPAELVRRLFEMREAGLLHIRGKPDARPTPAAMVADALAHDCYEDFESSREPLWDIVATDAGYTRIEQRLGPQ